MINQLMKQNFCFCVEQPMVERDLTTLFLTAPAHSFVSGRTIRERIGVVGLENKKHIFKTFTIQFGKLSPKLFCLWYRFLINAIPPPLQNECVAVKTSSLEQFLF